MQRKELSEEEQMKLAIAESLKSSGNQAAAGRGDDLEEGKTEISIAPF